MLLNNSCNSCNDLLGSRSRNRQSISSGHTAASWALLKDSLNSSIANGRLQPSALLDSIRATQVHPILYLCAENVLHSPLNYFCFCKRNVPSVVHIYDLPLSTPAVTSSGVSWTTFPTIRAFNSILALILRTTKVLPATLRACRATSIATPTTSKLLTSKTSQRSRNILARHYSPP